VGGWEGGREGVYFVPAASVCAFVFGSFALASGPAALPTRPQTYESCHTCG